VREGLPQQRQHEQDGGAADLPPAEVRTNRAAQRACADPKDRTRHVVQGRMYMHVIMAEGNVNELGRPVANSISTLRHSEFPGDPSTQY
jgi:hypothetical protein